MARFVKGASPGERGSRIPAVRIVSVDSLQELGAATDKDRAGLQDFCARRPDRSVHRTRQGSTLIVRRRAILAWAHALPKWIAPLAEDWMTGSRTQWPPCEGLGRRGFAESASLSSKPSTCWRLKVPHLTPSLNAMVRCYYDQPAAMLPTCSARGGSRELLARVASDLPWLKTMK